jgi:glycosyltransferase involved in cell wall biosynthesis
LCLGRLVPSKGFHLAIAALALARHEVDARLEIIGDGPQRDELLDLSVDLGVAELVSIPGVADRQEVWRRLAAATAVVMPSVYEGLPLVALEAAAMGRPVIGSRAASLAEIVVSGVTGLLVDAEGPDEIATAMTTLARDPQLVARMGRAARALYQSERSLSACVDGYLDLYHRVGSSTVSNGGVPRVRLGREGHC